jgi:hypothetical protein
MIIERFKGGDAVLPVLTSAEAARSVLDGSPE